MKKMLLGITLIGLIFSSSAQAAFYRGNLHFRTYTNLDGDLTTKITGSVKGIKELGEASNEADSLNDILTVTHLEQFDGYKYDVKGTFTPVFNAPEFSADAACIFEFSNPKASPSDTWNLKLSLWYPLRYLGMYDGSCDENTALSLSIFCRAETASTSRLIEGAVTLIFTAIDEPSPPMVEKR